MACTDFFCRLFIRGTCSLALYLCLACQGDKSQQPLRAGKSVKYVCVCVCPEAAVSQGAGHAVCPFLAQELHFGPKTNTHTARSLSLSPLLRHVAPGRMFAILDSQALKAKGGGKGHNRHRAGSLQAKGADLAPLPPLSHPLSFNPPSLCLCLCCMPLENSFMLKCANLLSTLYASCCACDQA